jgi:hypothetical protein
MSTLKADTIVASDGTSPVTLTKQTAAKSTVVYDQTVPSITGSFNISSLTDNSTGRATLDFTNNKSAVDYSAVNGVGMKLAGYSGRLGETNPFSTSQYEQYTFNHAGTVADYTASSVVTFGDLL